MSREAGAHLLVGGVGREAAGVADGGAPHARHLPEHALGSPEASHPEDGRLEALREGRLEAVAVHEVPLGHRDPLRAAAQGFVLLDHPGLVSAEQERHEISDLALGFILVNSTRRRDVPAVRTRRSAPPFGLP